mgnify:CR=1 FL=1
MVGTIIPAGLLIILGIIYLATGGHSNMDFNMNIFEIVVETDKQALSQVDVFGRDNHTQCESSVQSFYQILSQLTVILYLIMYLLMFSGAIALRYKMNFGRDNHTQCESTQNEDQHCDKRTDKYGFRIVFRRVIYVFYVDTAHFHILQLLSF